MGLFSKQSPKLPDYADVGLDELLRDPLWSRPIAQAGIDPAACDVVHRVGSVMMSAKFTSFSDGLPFLLASPAVIFVQGDTLGIAAPDERTVIVVTRKASEGRLMLTRFGSIQVVFGSDATVDGWTFDDLRKETPEGREFGELLLRHVASG